MNLMLLEEGLIAMCIGMGVVLSFLVILIFAMRIMSKAVEYLNKIFPEIVVAPAKSKKTAAVKGDEQVAVAIAAVLAKA